MRTEDEVCLFVYGCWFEGQIIQVDNDIALLQNLIGENGVYYSTAILINSIDAIQFTTDFRPNKNGALVLKEGKEDNK